jgi:hypothetical protein
MSPYKGTSSVLGTGTRDPPSKRWESNFCVPASERQRGRVLQKRELELELELELKVCGLEK